PTSNHCIDSSHVHNIIDPTVCKIAPMLKLGEVIDPFCNYPFSFRVDQEFTNGLDTRHFKVRSSLLVSKLVCEQIGKKKNRQVCKQVFKRM
uniref:Uncharacterized protein n=1 Tax=Hucho hucho TaxID=62062 RepID=A0A4W5LLY6_9TELE